MRAHGIGGWLALLLSACGTPAGKDALARAPAPAVPAEERAAPAAPAAESEPGLRVLDFLRAKYDADADGRIARGEYRRGAEAFGRLDADGDGLVSAADFAPEWSGRPRIEGTFVYGEGGPELGDPAPDFRLRSTAGETVELASFRGVKPVALVFGSFT